MQLVPYMPIHPAQLNKEALVTPELRSNDEEDELIQIANSSAALSDVDRDHVFKTPTIPTPYTVEEPNDSPTKRCPTMKR